MVLLEIPAVNTEQVSNSSPGKATDSWCSRSVCVDYMLGSHEDRGCCTLLSNGPRALILRELPGSTSARTLTRRVSRSKDWPLTPCDKTSHRPHTT